MLSLSKVKRNLILNYFQACSSIYFTLDALHQVHFLYQYSLHFFLDVFTDVLSNNPNIKDHTDYTRRLSIITNDLFQVCCFNWIFCCVCLWVL